MTTSRRSSMLVLVALLCACSPGPHSSIEPTVVGSSMRNEVELPTVTVPTAEASISPDRLGDAQAHIAAREYWASQSEQGLQAPNRAHDFRTYFDATGVRIEDRDAAERSDLVRLELSQLGRVGSLRAVPDGVVADRGEGRVEIERAELGIVEWFENSSAGLEQGFTLARRPSTSSSMSQRRAEATATTATATATATAKTARADALVVELTVEGAQATLAGDSIRLATATGRPLEYGKLVVVDAQGVELASYFEVPSSDRIRILVDDASASYPIVIDPLLTGVVDAVVESNQAGTEFGVSAAAAGDVNGDGFDDVIVGADLYDAGQLDEGAAFIFLGGPNGIGNGNPATAHAVLEGNQNAASFGASVASAGDVNGDGYADVVVGAFRHDVGQLDEGAAFVFHGSASGVASGGPAIAHGSVESDQANAGLGLSVAGAGDVNGDGYSDVVVGAFTYDGGQADEGAALVLLGSATGIGSRNPVNAHARFEGDQAGAQYGQAVGSAGDVNGDGYSDVIVGAPYYDLTQIDQGGAFLYLGSATGLTTRHATFIGQASSRFGNSVSEAGDVNGDGYGDLILGAPFHTAGQTNEGAAFVFHGSSAGIIGPAIGNTSFSSDADQTLESNQSQSRYGASAASAGDVNGDGYGDVIVGAYAFDVSQTNEGVAAVYLGSAAGILGSAFAVVDAGQANAFLGYSVASAGDVNGDGFDDVVTGAYLADGGQSDEGAAFVYHGGASAIAAPPDGIANAVIGPFGGSSESPGSTARSAGDLNGDGYGDLVTADAQFGGGLPGQGAVYIFMGSAVGINQDGTPDVVLAGAQAGARFGTSAAGAGDVNGDGYDDLIVGASGFDSPDTEEGAAYLFYGSPTGLASGDASMAATRLESDQVGARFGSRVAGVGDVNGDGYGDIAVAAYYYDDPEFNEGAVFVYHGGPSGIASGGPASATTRLEPDQVGGVTSSSPPIEFGRVDDVGAAGDVNGDGYGDLLVVSTTYDAGQANEGAAFVFLGGPAGIASGSLASAHARFESNQAGTILPIGFPGLPIGTLSAAASAGDVNGDGFDDVIIGLSGYSGAESEEGAALVFHGSATGMTSGNPATAETRIEGDAINAFAGQSVSSAGDVNGDGYSDVLLSAYSGSNAIALVFHGTSSGITAANALVEYETRFTFPSPALFDESVDRLATAGDLNGDGYADIVIGVRTFANGFYSETDHVFLGNSRGRPTLVRQRRGDASNAVVAAGGKANATDRFVVEMMLRSPRGRERGKLEIQACPSGVAFGQPACTTKISNAYLDLGTMGVVSSDMITGLQTNRSYSWRVRGRYLPYAAPQSLPIRNDRVGPWIRLQAQSKAGNIRTVPEPGIGIGAAAAISLLVGLGYGRRSRSGRSLRGDPGL